MLVLEDEQPGQSRVVVGGSFSESDRVEYLDQDNDRIPEITGDGDPSPGVALFRFQTPREPGTGGVTADTGNNGTGLGAGGPVGPASNLALTGTATQSSTGNGRTADRTIDGNANTALAGNSVTETGAADGSPWWKVELAQQSQIDEITLTASSDGEELANVVVYVTDQDHATIEEVQADPETCLLYTSPSPRD